MNPPRQLWLHPFASKRFHVLLNSLFKVLFNFPSRYLSAIGLVLVFSLRWSLPPVLSCIPKQLDSKDSLEIGAFRSSPTGLTPSLVSHNQVDLEKERATRMGVLNTTFPYYQSSRIRCWASSCSLAVTKEIPVGFFSSA